MLDGEPYISIPATREQLEDLHTKLTVLLMSEDEIGSRFWGHGSDGYFVRKAREVWLERLQKVSDKLAEMPTEPAAELEEHEKLNVNWVTWAERWETPDLERMLLEHYECMSPGPDDYRVKAMKQELAKRGRQDIAKEPHALKRMVAYLLPALHTANLASAPTISFDAMKVVEGPDNWKYLQVWFKEQS